MGLNWSLERARLSILVRPGGQHEVGGRSDGVASAGGEGLQVMELLYQAADHGGTDMTRI